MGRVPQGREIASPNSKVSFSPYHAHSGYPGGGRLAQVVDAGWSCLAAVKGRFTWSVRALWPSRTKRTENNANPA